MLCSLFVLTTSLLLVAMAGQPKNPITFTKPKVVEITKDPIPNVINFLNIASKSRELQEQIINRANVCSFYSMTLPNVSGALFDEKTPEEVLKEIVSGPWFPPVAISLVFFTFNKTAAAFDATPVTFIIGPSFSLERPEFKHVAEKQTKLFGLDFESYVEQYIPFTCESPSTPHPADKGLLKRAMMFNARDFFAKIFSCKKPVICYNQTLPLINFMKLFGGNVLQSDTRAILSEINKTFPQYLDIAFELKEEAIVDLYNEIKSYSKDFLPERPSFFNCAVHHMAYRSWKEFTVFISRVLKTIRKKKLFDPIKIKLEKKLPQTALSNVISNPNLNNLAIPVKGGYLSVGTAPKSAK